MSPACSALMAKMIRETFEWQEIAVFEGDAAVSTALLELPFDHIFFTGSPAVDKMVMTAASRRSSSMKAPMSRRRRGASSGVNSLTVVRPASRRTMPMCMRAGCRNSSMRRGTR
jgi:hypothetical protein